MKKLNPDTYRIIVQLLTDGKQAADIAEQVNCSVPLIYKISKETGLKIPKKAKLDAFDNEIKRDIKSGMSLKKCSKKYGVHHSTLMSFCKKNNIEYNSPNQENRLTEIPDLVSHLLPGFEYVSGYKNSRGSVILRCCSCGKEKEIQWQSVRKSSVRCQSCADIARKEKADKNKKEQEKKQIEKQKARQLKEEYMRVIREKEAVDRIHPCLVCGTLTTRKKYCSDRCNKKADNKKRETKRRIKLKNAKVDTGITVESLYKRDGGICYLCGKQCRMDDYITKEKIFIAGDWYPSIDHIIPLAKGGEHSWENVRLAHRICNSRKSDSIPLSATIPDNF